MTTKNTLGSLLVFASLAAWTMSGSPPYAAAEQAMATADVATPAGFKRVVDDTGSVAIAVPESWAVETAPHTVNDTFVRRISGGPGAGGVSLDVSLWPYAADLQIFPPCDPQTMECPSFDEQPFDNGRFVGVRRSGEECCGGPPFVSVIANPTNNQFTSQLFFSYTEPADVAVFETILGTVEAVDDPPTPPAPSPPPPGNLPPAVASEQAELWPYIDSENVPQLGIEPVRASGCGANGEIGETIPDGL